VASWESALEKFLIATLTEAPNPKVRAWRASSSTAIVDDWSVRCFERPKQSTHAHAAEKLQFTAISPSVVGVKLPALAPAEQTNMSQQLNLSLTFWQPSSVRKSAVM
jgi:hypothetical protein